MRRRDNKLPLQKKGQQLYQIEDLIDPFFVKGAYCPFKGHPHRKEKQQLYQIEDLLRRDKSLSISLLSYAEKPLSNLRFD